MGWHYGPCKELSWLWLIPILGIMYAAYEIHKHIREVEHVATLVAIGIGIFAALGLAILLACTVGYFLSDRKADKLEKQPVYEAELVDYNNDEEAAVRRAREML